MCDYSLFILITWYESIKINLSIQLTWVVSVCCFSTLCCYEYSYPCLLFNMDMSTTARFSRTFYLTYRPAKASLVARMVKDPPAVQETWIPSLGWEDSLEEGMATHSSILAWRIAMDRGVWWATVHGVAKSRTRLKQ